MAFTLIMIANIAFTGNIASYNLYERTPDETWGIVSQKQVSRAWTSNYIPHFLWDVFTCSCPWYWLLAHKSSVEVFYSVYHYTIQGWFKFAPSQWETSLQSNAVSHWNLESALSLHELLAWSDNEVIYRIPFHPPSVRFQLGVFYQQRLTEIDTLISNSVPKILGNVIIQPQLKYNVIIFKPPLKFGNWWMATSPIYLDIFTYSCFNFC